MGPGVSTHMVVFMRSPYAGYYESYRPLAPLQLLLRALTTRGYWRRTALLNRMSDYRRLKGRPELFRLHGQLEHHRWSLEEEWKGYDYGEGYYYQGSRVLGITGFRDTEARVECYGLLDRVKGKTVLDIGCNSGFLAHAIAPAAESVVGIEINSHLVDISRTVCRYSGYPNCRFHASSFEKWLPGNETFDVVMSLANHSTFDGNTAITVSEYLQKCVGLLNADGRLLFESHAPAYETEDRWNKVLAELEERFEIEDRTVMTKGNHMDRGRRFLVLRVRANTK